MKSPPVSAPLTPCSLCPPSLPLGRTHQLRVHMSALGHPVLGDPFYAHEEAKAMAPRLYLHAMELRIRHPVTGEKMRFESPVPFTLPE